MNDQLEKFPMLMKLCDSYRENYSSNFYIKVIHELPTGQKQFLELESNLELLDPINFALFEDEVITKGEKDKDRVYSPLTDRFNELKGFCYLKENGFKDIRIIPRAKKYGQQTPDLEATDKIQNDTILEVKTANNSAIEIEMLLGKNDTAGRVLDSIPKTLVNKIKKGISEKKTQIDYYNYHATNKIILMVIKLDISCSITDAPILHMQEIMIDLAKESLPYKIVWLIEGFEMKRIKNLNLSGFREL